jgi:hypothetical protein
MATKTFTMASATDADRAYIDRLGETHTITQNQTFSLDMEDLDGSAGLYTGLVTSSEMTCEDGTKINLEGDKTYTSFYAEDATLTGKGGEICIVEEGGHRAHWKIKTMNLDDGDVPTTCECVLERTDDPMTTISWAGITVA